MRYLGKITGRHRRETETKVRYDSKMKEEKAVGRLLGVKLADWGGLIGKKCALEIVSAYPSL